MKRKATLAACLAAGLGLAAAQAQTDFYKADNGTAMGQTGSWVGGVVPGTGDRVWFSENTANRSANTGTFNHNWIGIVVTNSAFNWTLTGRNIALGTEGINLAAGNGGNFTLPGVRLRGDQTWNVADAARTLTVNGGSYRDASISGDSGGGGYSVTKTGTGTVVLNAPSSEWNGDFIVNGGTVSAGADNVFGGTGTLVLNDGASFACGNKTQTNNIAINGNVNIDGNGHLSGAISGSGSITHGVGPAFRLNLRGDNSGFSGVITNNATLATDNKNGFGSASLVLNDGSSLAALSQSQLFGPDALANDIELNGTVLLGASNAGGNFELAGDISGDGGLAMTVLGGFDVKVTLSGANTYAGNTDVLDGFLTINGDNSGAAGTVTVAAGAGLGGGGTIGGDVVFADGALFLFDPDATLTVADGKTVGFENFGVAHLLGLDSSVELGTYALIDGTVDFANIANTSAGTAYDLGDGKSAYFEQGSLDLVVIPEPATLGLVAVSAFGLLLLRRLRL